MQIPINIAVDELQKCLEMLPAPSDTEEIECIIHLDSLVGFDANHNRHPLKIARDISFTKKVCIRNGESIILWALSI